MFLQVLAFCQGAGMVKLGHVALDGTKVQANASGHKAMSYQRMRERAAQLQGEVNELLRRGQEVDEEDRRYGRDKRGDELPEGLSLSSRRRRPATAAGRPQRPKDVSSSCSAMARRWQTRHHQWSPQLHEPAFSNP